MYASRKQANASGMTPSASLGRSDGNARSGSPAGSTPTVLKPICARGVIDSATIDAITTNSATGRAGNNFSPATNSAIAATPNARTIGCVSGIWLPSFQTRSKKLSPPPETPKSFGN